MSDAVGSSWNNKQIPLPTKKVFQWLTCHWRPRDRVCGTIDIEKALSQGKAFEPGLLAKANRGILYVDEVNLLDDHLVDVLLDSAASGWNTVEREVFRSPPASFSLVLVTPKKANSGLNCWTASGCTEIHTVKEPDRRVQIVEQRSEV